MAGDLNAQHPTLHILFGAGVRMATSFFKNPFLKSFKKQIKFQSIEFEIYSFWRVGEVRFPKRVEMVP